ncbi:MAG: TrkA family potassium uptake protein [Chloroflexi bacterium]|nr:TrkA family potassium uptake protein [Chloroflexota bacterium]
MYIIVVGCGKVGYPLVRGLLASGHEVLAIERDSHRAEEVSERLGSVVLSGDGSEATALAEAGAKRCDVLIAVTGLDEDNLMACQVAKHRLGVKRTIALVNDPQNETLFKALGVDVTVSHTDFILAQIEEKLPTQPLVHVMPLRERGRQIVDIRIPPDAAVVGKQLSELELPPDILISLVIGKDGTPRLPNGDTPIESGDEVVAVTPIHQEEALLDALTQAR